MSKKSFMGSIPVATAVALSWGPIASAEEPTPKAAEPASEAPPASEAAPPKSPDCTKKKREKGDKKFTRAKFDDSLSAKEKRKCRHDQWERDGKRTDDENSFAGMMSGARRSRCSTAICWGPSNRWALEPLAEIPVGKTVALSRSSLGSYINNSGINLRFNAGLRFWSEWDWWSLAIYFATPEIQAKETLVITGSSFTYPVSQIRRPLPGLALGLFGDNLWISVDYDVLRNGSTESTRDPGFPPNVVVSRTVSLTFAIAPFAGFRNGLGTLTEAKRRNKELGEAEEKARQAATRAGDAATRAGDAATRAGDAATRAGDAATRAEEATEELKKSLPSGLGAARAPSIFQKATEEMPRSAIPAQPADTPEVGPALPPSAPPPTEPRP